MASLAVNWKIKNFSVLLHLPDIPIKSALFKTMISEVSVSAYCYLLHDSTSMNITVVPENGFLNYDRLQVSFIAPDAEILVRKETSSFMSNTLRFENNIRSLLYDDTLHVCCRMWKTDMGPREIDIHTVLHRDDFSWDIVNFNLRRNNTFYIHTYIEKNKLLNMIIEGNWNQRTHKHHVVVPPIRGEHLSLVHLKPLIDAQHSSSITNLSNFMQSKWEIKNFLRENIDSNFPIQIEAIYAVHKEIPDRHSSPVSVNVTIPEVPGTLNADLLHLYREALHSDATLNAEGKSFPVHKSILSTRSEVFRAMFEKDQMKEGREGVVDIDDVDSQTVERLLVFMYGDLLKDIISWEEALALYYAADKYAVLPLKVKCAEILKVGLSVSNACEILAFADKHLDQDLMESTVDFILDHKKVISSAEWEELEESNSRLTSKVMKEILLKKWEN